MFALAGRPGLADWETTATSAAYRFTIADGTAIESSSLRLLPAEVPTPTPFSAVTLKEDARTSQLAVQLLALGALIGAGLGLFGSSSAFEETPFSIVPARPESNEFAANAAVVTSAPAAFLAFKDLGDWLDADDAQIADMVGVGRTTPYSWKRDSREPRAATAQRIYEHHATLDALRRRLGADGLRSWLHEGVAPRRDAILHGELVSLEDDVHAVLFHRSASDRPDLAAAPEADVEPLAQVPGTAALRPSGRRPRRLGTS